MAKFRITDDATGRSVVVSGDRAPTEAEAQEIFASLPAPQQGPTAFEEASMPTIDPATGEVAVRPASPEEPPRGIAERLIGGLETAATLGSGALAGVPLGVYGFGAGMAENLREGTFGTQEGVETVRRVFEEGLEMGTYTPKTETGIEYTENVARTLQPLEAAAGLLPQTRVIGEAARSGARGIIAPTSLEGPSRTAVDPELQGVRQTQELLASRGGTLSAFETQQAGRIRSFSEKIGDLGIISGAARESRRKTNAEIIANDIQSLIDGVDPSLIKERGELGDTVTSLIQEGKRAANDIYGKDLQYLKEQYGNADLDTRPIIAKLRNYLEDNYGTAGSKLDKETINLVEEQIRRLQGKVTDTKQGRAKYTNMLIAIPKYSNRVKIGDLLDEEKIFNQKVSDKGDFKSPGFNSVASKELSDVSKLLRDTINKQYSGQGYPELAKDHSIAKATYSTIQDRLFPKKTASLISKAAENNDFESVGRILINANNPTKIKALMNSANEAFAVLKKNKQLPESVKNPDQLRNSIKQSYLNNYFGEVTDDPNELFSAKYAKLYESLSKKNTAAPIKAVLGDDYGNFVRLTRAIKDASATQKSDPFTLALRSREISGTTVLAGGLFGAGLASGWDTAAVAALTVLTAPVFLSKMATNPRAVDKLLKLRSVDSTDPTETSRLTLTIMEDVINSVENKEDREEIKSLLEEQKKLLEANKRANEQQPTQGQLRSTQQPTTGGM